MKHTLNNSGQVLLIMVIALAIMVGVGVSISSQTLTSIKRTSQTDSLQKVTAAAEGGLERYLLLSDETLASKIGASGLVEKFPNSNTESNISVSKFDSVDGLTFPEVSVGKVANFFFSNDISSMTFSGLSTCLRITSSTPNPEFMLNVVVRNPSTPSVFLATHPSTNLTYDATTSNNFLMEKYVYKDTSFVGGVSPTSCGTNAYQFTNAAVLRIHPLKDNLKNLKIEVLSSGISGLTNVTQGYTVVSVGKFSSGNDSTTRKITASKYLDAPSNVFDFTAFIDY